MKQEVCMHNFKVLDWFLNIRLHIFLGIDLGGHNLQHHRNPYKVLFNTVSLHISEKGRVDISEMSECKNRGIHYIRLNSISKDESSSTNLILERAKF